jgi:hypothetical protein
VRNAWLTTGCLLLACGGSNPGSLSGSVGGHTLTVKEAVFTEIQSQVLLVAGDQANLCGLLSGTVLPVGSGTLFEGILAHYNGSFFIPLVPGDYALASGGGVSKPGRYYLGTFATTSGCDTVDAVQATNGAITIDAYEGARPEAHLKAKIALGFGSDSLQGDLNASYCAALDAPLDGGTACDRKAVLGLQRLVHAAPANGTAPENR